ncbi:MAG: FimV family protein [Methylococcaceae bacterium]|nr:FimV family protein [Methylococcaceae bacterium]
MCNAAAVTIVKERSVRNLTKTIAVVSILAPISAHPLGIGEIKLLSVLNQNLNAEISLVLSGEKPSDIQVQLAPPDKFNEAGVPWSYFLSKIKFQTIVHANGSVVIKLTSSEALKEPFLDLLLEVSWPKGSLYREFTVLVDPPAVYKEATVPVVTSPESYQPEKRYARPERAVSAKESETNFVASDGEYGPTKKNDTLWKIAEQVRPDNEVSVEQVMMALYQANPRAFYQDNVNALAAGKTLKVPEKEVILRLPRKQALAEFNGQTKAWRNRLAPTDIASAPAKENGPENHLTLDAPAEAVVNEAAVISPGDEQVAANDEKNAKSSATVSGEAEGSDRNDAIQSKIAALEKQLATMQQIITLKDQQLAELQNKTQAIPVVPDEPVKSTTQSTQSDADNKTSNVKSETVIQGQSVKPGAVVQPTQVTSVPVAEQQPTVIPKPVVNKSQPVIPSAVPPKTEDSTVSYYQVVGGIGASMLSIIGWLWWRKRKVEEEMNSESMFASSTLSKALSSTGGVINDSGSGSAPPLATESSFLSEFSSPDFVTFDIDQSEIDPLSEADVYLAYGRFHQAEELIRHAISDFPVRDDCKLKLLEIFQTTDNKTAFENYAKELADSGKKKDLIFWGKVTEMAHEICPDSILFASEPINFGTELPPEPTTVNLDKKTAPQGRVEQGPSKFTIDNDILGPDLDEQATSADVADFDFELPPFPTEQDDELGASENNTSIDFDLSIFPTDSDENNAVEKDLELSDANRVVEFDFNAIPGGIDVNSSSVDAAITKNVDEKVSIEADADLEGFDFSFDESPGLDEETKKIALDDDFQFDFDFETPLDSTSSKYSEHGVSDLTDMDELETKLDLARAYIDMGDADSAIDIVKEVLEKGSSEQKQMAQTLLIDLE